MAFQLNSVVPWGRNIDEYREMFLLSDDDMKMNIAGFGDGPASFNYQATLSGSKVTSFDPIYQFTREQLEQRIEEVRAIVMKQMAENKNHYVWDRITSLEKLESIRMSAMRSFLNDYMQGKKDQRYIYHELPDRLPCPDNSFDIHFLLMYTALGYDFHVASISEILRVCKQVRIFPLCDLDSNTSDMIEDVISLFRECYKVEIKSTSYEFQKGANRLLIISHE